MSKNSFPNFLNAAQTFLPAVLSRYSIQYLAIALPWILQNRDILPSDIGWIVSVFFLGSLCASVTAARFLADINIRSALIFVIMLQGITSSICFLVEDLWGLAALRFLHGYFTGLLRPMSQIWVLERSQLNSVTEKTRQATMGQVAISLGSVFANLMGSFSDLRKYFTLVEVKMALGIYFTSLLLFKIWLVGLPISWRASHDFLDSGSGRNLAAVLILTSAGFTMGQWALGRFASKLPQSRGGKLGWLISTFSLQVILVCAADLAGFNLTGWILLILGGGLFSAATYPVVCQILLNASENDTQKAQRHLFLFMSIAADLGQMMGSALLATASVLTFIPFHWVLVSPVLLVLIAAGINLLYANVRHEDENGRIMAEL